MAMEPILRVENLTVSFTRYGRGLSRVELTAIRDLSLTVEPGQVTAVVGSSGSGKSLLVHAIFHILRRNARMTGEVLFDGEPLTRDRAERLRGREMALIPQGVTCLDPMMRVGPQLRRGRGDPGAVPAVAGALRSGGGDGGALSLPAVRRHGPAGAGRLRGDRQPPAGCGR